MSLFRFKKESWAEIRRGLYIRLGLYLFFLCVFALYFYFRDGGLRSRQQPRPAPRPRPPVVGEAELSRPSQPVVVLLVPKGGQTDWEPLLAKLRAEFDGRYDVMKVELASDSGTAEFFQVTELPAVVLCDKDGCRSMPFPKN